MVRIQSGRILREKYLITVFCWAQWTDNNKLRLSILNLESLSLYYEYWMGGRTDALREIVILIKQRCRCVYELFIHAAALLFFRFWWWITEKGKRYLWSVYGASNEGMLLRNLPYEGISNSAKGIRWLDCQRQKLPDPGVRERCTDLSKLEKRDLECL